MANAKRCDRCGKFYVENRQEFTGCMLKHCNLMASSNIHFDLCDECIGKLWTFLNFPVEIDDAIDRYNQTKEDGKGLDGTSTLDTVKMNGRSTSL